MKNQIGVFCAALCLTACSGDAGEETLVYVDSRPVVCIGESQQLCLRVKHSHEQQWILHYGGIHGFSYTWGSVYALAYAKNEIKDPPADGSSIEWTLLDIVSQSEDEVGTEYDFDAVTMQDFTITHLNDDYAFLGYPFSCAKGVDCDALTLLSGSTQSVDLKFRYLGNADVELMNWE